MCDGYDVVVCTHCGAGFADGIPSQGEMDSYYSDRSKYSHDFSDGTGSPWDLKRFEETADQIIPHLKSRDSRILDIGCATGGLLSIFARRGFTNAIGVDPSPACAAMASRLHRVRVQVATFADLSNWDERFDLIMMLGVLEHVRETKDAVSSASRLLRPGGLLYCAVPNVDGLDGCPNAPYQQFSIEHVNFFSRYSLKRLMFECGMAETRDWTWTVEWREGVWEPIVSGLYTHGKSPMPAFDSTTDIALQRYLAFSEKGDRKIITTIDSLILSGEPVIIWGAGTLARRLLANTRFADVNIVAFVDSNPHFQNTQLSGRPIWHPKQISNRRETILICSISFIKEISQTVRIRHRLPNRIVSLIGEELT